MKHSIKSLLFTVLVAFVNVPVSAYDFEADGIYYNIVSHDGLTCEVTNNGDYDTYHEEAVIPEKVAYDGKTYSVARISDYAFSDCNSLRSVVIPNSILEIDTCAFYHCVSLKDLTIGDAVQTIGYSAFDYCYELENVVVPNSVMYIGDSAFGNCSSLRSVVIGNSVTEIDDFAFSQCGQLTSVTIGENVKSIGDYAFYGCSNLTDIVIPNNVTEIGNYAFGRCALQNVTIGKSVVSIGGQAIEGPLKNVYCLNPTPIVFYDFGETDRDDTFCVQAIFSNVSEATLYVPVGSLEAYKSTVIWQDFGEIKEMDFTGIKGISVDDAYSTKIYDIQGRELKAPQKGINIINGKKVLVK